MNRVGNPGPPGTAELGAIDVDTTALAACVTQAMPASPFYGVAVRIAESITLTTQPAPTFQASATPAVDALGSVVRVAGLVNLGADVTSYGEGVNVLNIIAYQGGGWSVSQADPVGADKPGWSVQGSDGVAYYQLAARVDVTDVRDRLPGAFTAGGGVKTGLVDELPAGTQAIGSVVANVGTTGGLSLDTTLTGGTQKAIVRGGAKGSTVAADVTSTSIDTNRQALDVAVHDRIGSSFDVIRGTATTVESTPTTQAYPRGFVIENTSMATSIYFRTLTGVTPANGWEIRGGDRESLELGNSDQLRLITSAGSATYQIGGIS